MGTQQPLSAELLSVSVYRGWIMYHALIEGSEIPVERLRWVKLQANGIFITCGDDEGQGIIVEGEIYHVHGRTGIDKPTVILVWHDDMTALIEEYQSQQANIDELILTVLEE